MNRRAFITKAAGLSFGARAFRERTDDGIVDRIEGDHAVVLVASRRAQYAVPTDDVGFTPIEGMAVRVTTRPGGGVPDLQPAEDQPEPREFPGQRLCRTGTKN